MITQMYSTTIMVGDQDEAKRFFTETLGWETRDDVPMGDMRWLTVVPPGAQTALSLAIPGMTGDDAETSTPGGWTGISFICDDIDATYRELTDKGVATKGDPEPMPWGDYGMWFYDPWRNEFFVAGERTQQ